MATTMRLNGRPYEGSHSTSTTVPTAFLRIQILSFQANGQPPANLSELRTRVELKEKHRSVGNDAVETPVRVKNPMYIEKEQCIPFDAGLLNKVKRQIIIRVHSNNIIYTFESDLDVIRKLADGRRHRFFFAPRAQAETIIKYKDASGRTARDPTTARTASRYAERRQQIFTHFGHEFVPKIFKMPVFCSVCSEFLWGFTYQGYQCQRCECVVHRQCYNQFACPCQKKKYAQLNINVAHHFEQQPFTLKPFFCDHCGSFIRPGHAHKCSHCAMVVHRRCTSNVGNYCGCEKNVLALYDKWKATHEPEPDSNYQYNEDLYSIYSVIDNPERPRDLNNAIERASRNYQPSITRGLNFDQFRLIRALGQGMNGSVYLAEYERNYYAMKVLRKNIVLEGQDLAYVMAEREVMIQSQSCPFIVQLIFAFQNAERLFFLMEVAQGGNFYRILMKQAPKPFRYERIIFHTGEIACALQFLHSKHIAYRDLKPENVLVFDDGHLKLGDFGLCRRDVDQNPRLTTFCGTQEYIAYEIYKHFEYDENVDWWSFGVLIYELFTFATPFYDEDEYQIEDNVLHKDVVYPETMPKEAKQFIAGLLERDSKRRLGNKLSPHGLLRDQPFFRAPYTLENIEHRRIPPPWVPTSIIPFESSSEEPRLSELEGKDRVFLFSAPPDTFRGFSYTSPQSITRF